MKNNKRLFSFVLACLMLCNFFPAQAFAQDTTETPKVVADWQFIQDSIVSGTSIEDGNLQIADSSGNGNTLEAKKTKTAADLTTYLSFAEEGLVGNQSLCFDNQSKFLDVKNSAFAVGAYFETVADAPVNEATLENGYTIEAVIKMPEAFTQVEHDWMGILTRGGQAKTIGKDDDKTYGTMMAGLVTMALKNERFYSSVWYNYSSKTDITDFKLSYGVAQEDADKWLHLAVVNDGTNSKVYVNGQESIVSPDGDTSTGIAFEEGQGWLIGATNALNAYAQIGTFPNLFQGNMERIRISEGALTKAQWLVSDFSAINTPAIGTDTGVSLLSNPKAYTMAFIPDLQNMTMHQPEMVDTMMEWLAHNGQDINLAGIGFLGDITDSKTVEQEFIDASDAIANLKNSDLKYLLAAGNHDDETLYKKYFTKDHYAGKNWYFNTSPSGTSAYILFNAGSYQYLMLDFDYCVSQRGEDDQVKLDEYAWANQVLKSHANLPAIVISHNILDFTYDEENSVFFTDKGQSIWDNLVKGNNNVFMTVAGHNYGSSYRIDQNQAGNDVINMVVDYQSNIRGGNGYMRFLEFDEAADKIRVNTYSPTVELLSDEEKCEFDVAYLTEPKNQYTLDFPFSQRLAGMAIPTAQNILSHLGSYATGEYDADGGVAEIVKYNSDNQKMYLVSGKLQSVDIVSLSGLSASGNNNLTLEKRLDINQLAADHGFTSSDITSIDVNTKKDYIAISVQGETYTDNGSIVLLDYDGKYITHFEAGCQPDMVTFTPDGNYVLSANEGEPRMGYGADAVDPKGSVTIVDLTAGYQNAASVTVDFSAFDTPEPRTQLVSDKVLLKPDTAPSVDLEPEYIAVSEDSKTAYVSLQEANAIATFDIAAKQFTAIKGLGFKDHSQPGNELDLNKDGKINIQSEAVYGVYMPDGLATIQINGEQYVLTPNEGDAREWGSKPNKYADVDSKVINGSEKKVEYLIPTERDGLDPANTYLYGARSFSIWKASDLSLVYDSGADFERITAATYPDYFNTNHKETELEGRTNKKGPEPEDVKTLAVGNKLYAFIGLERIGGIMAYDITDPDNTFFVDYLNPRNFSGTDIPSGGDLGAEGLCTIPAAQSPTGYPLVLAANEISGTVTIAQVNEGKVNPPQDNDDSDSSGNASTPSAPSTTVGTPKTEGGTTTVGVTVANQTQLTTSTIQSAVTAAVNQAKQQGTKPVLQLTVTGATASAQATLPAQALAIMADNGIHQLLFSTPLGTVTLDAAVLKDMTGANATLSVKSFGNGATFALMKGDQSVANLAQPATFSFPYSGNGGSNLVVLKDNSVVKNSLYQNGAMHFASNIMGSYTAASQPVQFNDLTAGSWYIDGVQFVAARQLFGGTGDGNFSPNSTMTRGMLVTVLGRLSDVPASGSTTQFSDVSADAYYAPYVAWAAQNGLVSGTGNGQFNPDAPITREQMATILYQYSNFVGLALESKNTSFTDQAAVSAWARDGVAALAGVGVLTGKEQNTFDPAGLSARSEVATMLMRFITLVVHS